MASLRRWPLEPVLRVRQIELDREEAALAAIHADIAATRTARIAAERDLLQLTEARNTLLIRSALDATYLRSLTANADALRERMGTLDEQLVLLHQKKAEQEARYTVYAQRRELLVILHDAEQARRSMAEARREQAVAEEAHLATRFFREGR